MKYKITSRTPPRESFDHVQRTLDWFDPPYMFQTDYDENLNYIDKYIYNKYN